MEDKITDLQKQLEASEARTSSSDEQVGSTIVLSNKTLTFMKLVTVRLELSSKDEALSQEKVTAGDLQEKVRLAEEKLSGETAKSTALAAEVCMPYPIYYPLPHDTMLGDRAKDESLRTGGSFGSAREGARKHEVYTCRGSIRASTARGCARTGHRRCMNCMKRLRYHPRRVFARSHAMRYHVNTCLITSTLYIDLEHLNEQDQSIGS